MDPARCPPPAGLSAAVGEVPPGSDAALVAAMGADGDLVAGRRARGCRAFCARRGGEVLAYGWLSSGPEWVGELGLEIRPAPGEAYIWNCFTLPPHRRQGHFSALVLGIAACARTEGLTRLWIGTIDDLGVRALRRAGFTPVLRFTVKALPWFRRLRVWPSEEAEPALLAAGRRGVYAGGRPVLGDSVLGRAGRRRH